MNNYQDVDLVAVYREASYKAAIEEEKFRNRDYEEYVRRGNRFEDEDRYYDQDSDNY